MTTTISMLAINLAKVSFQVYAVGPEGTILYNRSLLRTRLATLLAEQPACIVAMETCATSHHWVGWHKVTTTRFGLSRRPT